MQVFFILESNYSTYIFCYSFIMAKLVESEMVVFAKESFFLLIPLSLERALAAGNIGRGLTSYFTGWGCSLREWYPLLLGIKYCKMY